MSVRNDFIYECSYHTLDFLAKRLFYTRFENTEALACLKDKGFVLLPNHQSSLDIPMEGLFLKKSIGRPAYYVMKSTLALTQFLQMLGGIPVKQMDVLRKEAADEDQLRLLLHGQKEFIDSKMSELVDAGEIVVDHIEGERRYGKPFRNRRSIISRLSSLKTREDPYFVPLRIEYEKLWHPMTRITVTAGDPIQTRDPDTLECHIDKYLGKGRNGNGNAGSSGLVH